MPTLIPYHLTFAQGLRLSDRGLTLGEAAVTIPADTLFAALVDACARSGDDAAAFAQPFLEHRPPFLLTSAFPRVGRLRFYPVPVDVTLVLANHSSESAKRMKKVRFLSEALFRRALAGEKLDAWWQPPNAQQRQGGVSLQQGALWLSSDELPLLPAAVRTLDGSKRNRPVAALRELAIWGTERAPHVAVDRVQSATDIYFVGRTHFRSECGLWFGIQQMQSEVEGRVVEPLGRYLRLLEVEGLGGKRSSGNGGFTWTQPDESISLPEVATGRPAWLLSRVSPRAEELPHLLHDERAAYKVTSVAGWMRPASGPALRRKRLALVEAGSWVVPVQSLIGQIVDVRPAHGVGHPVYRYGYGVAAGIGQEE